MRGGPESVYTDLQKNKKAPVKTEAGTNQRCMKLTIKYTKKPGQPNTAGMLEESR
jgi:hypothetical protein